MEDATKRKLSRAERGEVTRIKLMNAAAKTVGDFGYASASIARICEHAGIAQGTFYNYFSSRQEIFDLLPVYYGEKMLRYISEQVRGDISGIDREVRRLEVFFNFFDQHREIARVVNEAPILAPKGYANFYTNVTEGYVRALRRSMAKGEIRELERDEMIVLADIMIAIRNGLSQQMLARQCNPQIQTVLAVYRELMSKAIYAC